MSSAPRADDASIAIYCARARAHARTGWSTIVAILVLASAYACRGRDESSAGTGTHAPPVAQARGDVGAQADPEARPYAGAPTDVQAQSGTPVDSASPPTAVVERGAAWERALAARVSEERALARIRELVALGPRMGGTPSGDRAAAYRAAAFESLGLPVRVLDEDPKWCHHESSWAVEIVSDGKADAAPATPLESAWPYGFSPRAGGVGCLALEGEPTCRDAGAQFVALGARRPRVKQGQRAPAAALVDGRTTLDGAYPVLEHLAEGAQNPFPVFGLSRGDGALVRARAAAGEHLHVRYRLDATIARGRPKTVIASLAARAGAPPGYLLFCAHGDSDAGGPGADDNASGEAVLLEIASAWKAAIDAGEAPAPAREVRFAIWGSEISSTRAYIAERVPAEGALLAVVNYDQAGFGSGADQLNVEPDDLEANASFVHTVVALLAEMRGTPGFPERWATNKSLGGTDSYVFSDSAAWKAAPRPAVTLFTSAWGKPEEHPKTPGMPGESWSARDLVSVDYDNYYHSSGDTPENTTDREPWNVGWCARVGAIAAGRWLEALPGDR